MTEVFVKEWSELVLREAPRRIGSEQLEACQIKATNAFVSACSWIKPLQLPSSFKC